MGFVGGLLKAGTKIASATEAVSEMGAQIAKNKAVTIPMKEKSIRSEADKDAARDELKIVKIEERKDTREENQELDKWIATLRVMGRGQRKRKLKVKQLIRSGANISNIQRYEKQVIIFYDDTELII